MLRVMLWSLVLLVPAPALWAKDAKDRPKPSADEFQSLLKEYQEEQQTIIKEFQQSKSNEEKEKLRARYFQLGGKYAGRFLKHVKDPRIASFCQQLASDTSDDTVKLLRAVVAQNPDRTVKGQACYTLAQNFKNRAESAARAKKPDADKLAQEAEKYFEQTTSDYGDVRSGGGTLGQGAKAELFVLKHLAVGKTAPEIEGEDVDGKKFKLSDYRGKVVLLDFWGNW